MGLFKFEDLPVNTLVGTSLGTFNKVTYGGKEVDKKYKSKYRLSKFVSAILTPIYKINDRMAANLRPIEGVKDPVFIIGHWRSGTTFITMCFPRTLSSAIALHIRRFSLI